MRGWSFCALSAEISPILGPHLHPKAFSGRQERCNPLEVEGCYHLGTHLGMHDVKVQPNCILA